MAKQKPFRCSNPLCTTDATTGERFFFDFWSERPVCPKCKVDGKAMPQVVFPLEIHHFDPPSAVPGVHTRLLACTGRTGGGAMMTGNPNHVNCPECRATDAFKKAAEEHGVEILDEDGEQQAIAVLVKAAQEGV